MPAAVLARQLNKSEPVKPAGDQQTHSENRTRAAGELSSISELLDSTAFNWFFEKCLEAKFVECRDELHDPNNDEPYEAKVKFLLAKELVRWLKERELQHRRLLNSGDTGLDKIREELKRFE